MNSPTCDSERMTFLRALDDAADVDVTDFEARFIESALKFQTTSPAFSERQREVVDGMFKAYGHRVKGPAVTDRRSNALPEPITGQCAWLVKREGAARQTRCGQPIVEGRNFCAEHETERERVKAKLREFNLRKMRS